MRLKKLGSLFSAVVLTVSSLLTVGFAPLAHATAQTCVWTGGGSDSKFSTSGNWSSCGGSVPQAGDTVSFGVVGSSSSTPTLTNDLGVALGGIMYGDSTKDASVTTYYSIDTLNLADNAVVTEVNAQSLTYSNASIALGALTVGNHLTFNGHYVGFDSTGSDINVPVQNLTIEGTGLSTLSQGGGGAGGGGPTVNFQPVNLTIDTGSEYFADLSTVTSVTTQDGARVYLYSTSGTSSVTLNLGASTAADPGLVTSGDLKLTGNVTLNGDTYYFIYGVDTLTVSGALSGTGALKVGTGSTGTFVNSASSNTSQTPSGTQTVAVTELPAITDSQPNTTLDVLPKTIVALDGARGFVDVLAGATLKGTGTANALYVDKDGTVAPGHSPGRLTVVSTLNLAGGSTYQAELKDKADGDFDQIVVGAATDTDNNNPDVTLGDTTSSPALAVSLYTGYKIAQGDTFEIINNLSKTDVKGTFANLAEGGTVTVNGYVFSISYKGGDGNDVVLTAKTVPATPNTGFQLVSAHPLQTLAVAVIASGMILGVARSSRKTTARR